MSTVSVDRTQARQYAHAGARYFSVSQVLQLLTGGGYLYGSQEAMQRGTDLHAWFAWAVDTYAGNERAQPDLNPDYLPYTTAIYAWLDHAKPLPLMIEEPEICATGLPFAGTPDLLASVNIGGVRKIALIDLKTGAPSSAHKVQVQAYAKLAGYTGAEVLQVLYIDSATFKIVTVQKSPRDWAAFQSALSVLTWRES